MEVFKSFLIVVVVLSFGVAIIAGQNGLLSARCAARCLTEHKDSLRQGNGRNNHRKYMLDRCRRTPACYECTKPCSAREEDLIERRCEEYCKPSEPQCKQSCLFMYYIHTIKAGDCAKPETATGFEAVCLASCRIDGDCPDSQKCCPNMCGYACREPNFTGYQLPMKPADLHLEEKRKGRSLHVTWILPERNQTGSGVVIYVLEHRKTTNQRPVWKANIPWETILVTQSKSVLLRRINAGHWYQFRVAAVTDAGTQGFSSFSQSFKSSRDVQLPTPPQNVTEGVTTLRKGQVDVTIHWQPPKYSDLPVWKYSITWREILTSISPVLVRIPVLEKEIPGNVLEFKLKKLKPGASYHIELSAIVQHGNRQLRSKKTSKTITTYEPPNKHSDKNKAYYVYADIIRVENLQVVDGAPYFDQGSLKANLKWNVGKDFLSLVKSYMIYWTPQSCDQDYATPKPYSATSDLTSFEVYDLQYECQYLIEVSAVTKKGVQGKPSRQRLTTPVCQEILVKSNSLPPECPTREAQVPRSPRAVNAKIIKNNCSIALELSWKHPKSDKPIESYQIKYEVSDSFKEPKTDTGDSVYKPIPVEIAVDKLKAYTIEGLRPSELYIIHIQAVSAAGTGDPAIVEILTPRLAPCDDREERVVEVPKIPRKVFARIMQDNCSLSINISWKHPRSSLPIDSYLVTYVLMEDKDGDKRNTREDSEYKPVEIILAKVNAYTIEDLRPSSVYIIHVYAISQAGRGIPAYIEIITPQILPCGSDKDPKPPDTAGNRETTHSISTVFHTPEGSTSSKGITKDDSIATVSIATRTTGRPGGSSQQPKLNIYKTVYYLLLFIYKILLRL